MPFNEKTEMQNMYSPIATRPFTLEEKKIRLESDIVDLRSERQKLVERKQEIELEIGNYNSQVRGKHLPEQEYENICRWQSALKREKLDIEKKLADTKSVLQKKELEKDNLSLNIKKVNEEAKQHILEIRDKYMSFAADTTRVSSMRAMASKFSEELTFIMTKM